MKEYIEKDAALETTYELFTMSMCMTVPECNGMNRAREMIFKQLRDIPAADVVPWEWLERYADYFCAEVSMPEFIREAKMFYESTNKAMQGGVIDG